MKRVFFILLASSISSLSFGAKTPAIKNYRTLALPLDHNISDVTTYSDRAKVVRKSQLKSIPKDSKGWIHLSGLHSSIDKNSIRLKILSNENVSLEQIIIEDSYEYVSLDKNLKEKLSKLKDLYAQKLDQSQNLSLVQEKYQFVKSLKFTPPFKKNNYVYQGFNAPVSSIGVAFEATQVQSLKYLKEIEAIKDKMKNLDDEIDLIKNQIQNRTNTGSQRWVTNVFAKLSNPKAKGQLQLTYFIPKAKWFPIYDIRADLDLKKGRANIKLISAGLLEQHTGENWEDVNMTLSTLDPTPLYLPQLRKWSFQEVREEAPAEEDSFGGEGLASNFSAKSEMKADRIAPRKMSKAKKRRSSRKRQMRAKESAMALGKLAPAPSSAPVMAESEEMMDMDDVLVSSNTFVKDMPVSKGGRYLFPLKPISQIFNELSSVESQVRNLENYQIQYRSHNISGTSRPTKNSYGDSRLPAVAAGGRVIEHQSPFKVDLKSDENPLKIPLNAQNLYGELKYFTIPKKDKRVFIRAKTKNTTKFPLLAGKAQVFMNGDLITKTSLNTISEDSHFTVELGVDKGVETQRLVKKSSEGKGLVFKKHSTDVEVKIEVSNSHNFPIDITVKDHYPLSPNDDIEVKLGEVIPAPNYKKHGYLTWNEKIKAKEKKVFTFKYKVTHPENYIISEFN